MFRCVLRPQPQRGEPRNKPVPQRDTERCGGDASIHDNGVVVGHVREEALDHRNLVVQRVLLLHGELSGQRWGVERSENGVQYFGHICDGGNL